MISDGKVTILLINLPHRVDKNKCTYHIQFDTRNHSQSWILKYIYWMITVPIGYDRYTKKNVPL